MSHAYNPRNRETEAGEECENEVRTVTKTRSHKDKENTENEGKEENKEKGRKRTKN